MARAFDDASSQYLENISGGPATAAPLTIVAWFNTDDLTITSTIVQLQDKDTAVNRFGLAAGGVVGGDPVIFFTEDAGANQTIQTSTGFSANTWHHAGAVAASSTDRRVFIDGGSKGTGATAVTPAGIDSVSIGRSGDSTPSNYMSGFIAEVGIWNVALSDAEMALLGKGFSPLFIQPQNLVFYAPLIRNDDNDLIGGFDLTASGSPTVTTHPPLVVHPTVPPNPFIITTTATPTHLSGLATVTELPLQPSLLEGTVTIFTPLIKKVFKLLNQRPLVATPGLAQYKMRLKDQSGSLVAEFDTWRSLNFTHKVNNRGSIRFEIGTQLPNGKPDTRIDLFELDGQMEVWRKNPIVDLDWYIEWEGFYRTLNDKFFEDDDNSFVAYGFSYLDLVYRAYIMWLAGSSQATKNMVSETAMKEFVSENAGVLALASAGREADNVYPGLTIQADEGAGAIWEGSAEEQSLIDTLKKITLFTQQNDEVVDFDIVGTGAAEFEFRTYAGQRGTDRRSSSSNPVIFSRGYGNLIIPVLSKNRSSEITAAYGVGRGTGNARQIELVESTAKDASPWNRIEKVFSASSTSGEDQSGQLIAKAEEELEKNKFQERLSFNILQTKNTYYGKDYTWGDLVTMQFKDETFDKKITEVNVTVSKDVAGEQISLTFADN